MKGIGRVVTKLCSGHGVTDTHTHTEGQTDGHTAIIELPAAANPAAAKNITDRITIATDIH